jgi:hypothetical protein
MLFIERSVTIGNVALPLTPAEFGRKGAEDLKRFGALIRARGMRGDDVALAAERR